MTEREKPVPAQTEPESVDPDADAIRRVRSGDASAYGEIVERHEPALRALVTGILADRQVAEDVVQDVFLIGYRNLDGFRGEAKLSTWLTRIAIREATRARTRLRKLLRRLAPLEEARTPSPKSHTRAAEARDEALSLLARLSSIERTAFVLHVVESRSYQEIAEILGIPIGTVGSHISRARARLREHASRAEGALGALPEGRM